MNFHFSAAFALTSIGTQAGPWLSIKRLLLTAKGTWAVCVCMRVKLLTGPDPVSIESSFLAMHPSPASDRPSEPLLFPLNLFLYAFPPTAQLHGPETWVHL